MRGPDATNSVASFLSVTGPSVKVFYVVIAVVFRVRALLSSLLLSLAAEPDSRLLLSVPVRSRVS